MDGHNYINFMTEFLFRTMLKVSYFYYQLLYCNLYISYYIRLYGTLYCIILFQYVCLGEFSC